MTLIERYLAAVAAQLPSEQREDIIAELRDLILTRFEEREEELGRPLQEGEREEILREFGHPLVVAARYRPGPDALVGPELYPYWRFAVKAGLLLVLSVQAIRLIVQVVSLPAGSGGAISDFIHGVIGDGLTLVGLATVVVALLEHYRIRPDWLGRWRPRHLEAFGFPDPGVWGGRTATRVEVAAASSAEGSSRAWRGSDHILSLLALAVFVLWWIGAIQIPALMTVALPGQDALVRGAPVWTSLHGFILIYALAQMALHGTALVCSGAVRGMGLGRALIAAAGLWLTWKIFAAGHWFTLEREDEVAQVAGDVSMLNLRTLKALGEGGPELAGVAANLSIVATWVLAMIAAGLLIELAQSLWRMVRG